MRTALLLLSIAIASACPALPSSPNLIANGSFEEASVSPGSFVDLPAGSTALKDWTVTLNHIDYANAGLWLASNGSHSLDLEGSACNTRTTTECLGGVKQTFATVKGQNYDVSFDLAGNPYGGSKVKTLKVSAAGQSMNFTFDISGHNVRSMGWKIQHWTFTAQYAATTLEFDSADSIPNLSGWGPALDNVIVTSAAAK
jgi:choice-of-anchor C domain-containing protein